MSYNTSISSSHSDLLHPAQPSPWVQRLQLILQPLRSRLDQIEIHDRQIAHWLCTMIPAHCPFERDLKVWGRIWFHIPPLCKLNPLYEEVVGLRFRALSFLADQCGEDITPYLQAGQF